MDPLSESLQGIQRALGRLEGEAITAKNHAHDIKESNKRIEKALNDHILDHVSAHGSGTRWGLIKDAVLLISLALGLRALFLPMSQAAQLPASIRSSASAPTR